ncbi:MAG: MBL fold metallo-hydrolase [Gammaproteobacteria bacterium]|nr:MAG: MBL fold metallo-hydrolase [Gammaproteobacteria bacterium]
MNITLVGCGDAFASGRRFNTCLHVVTSRQRFLLDCGATSLTALRAADIERDRIDTIFITHFHADHFFGLPFLILDAHFIGKRSRTLRIVGPEGLEARLAALLDLSFGKDVFDLIGFRIDCREISPGETLELDGLSCRAERMVHSAPGGTCLGYRIAADDRTLAFTGDTEWNDNIIAIGRNADLLLSECCGYRTPVPTHLDLATLERKLPSVGARRVVLVHMGQTLLDNAADCDFEMGFDGMQIEI